MLMKKGDETSELFLHRSILSVLAYKNLWGVEQWAKLRATLSRLVIVLVEQCDGLTSYKCCIVGDQVLGMMARSAGVSVRELPGMEDFRQSLDHAALEDTERFVCHPQDLFAIYRCAKDDKDWNLAVLELILHRVVGRQPLEKSEEQILVIGEPPRWAATTVAPSPNILSENDESDTESD